MPELSPDEAVGRLRALVVAVADAELGEVAADTRFYEELAIDSLQMIELVERIEAEFEVPLAPEDVAGVNSIAQVLVLLRERGAATTPS